MPITLDKFHVGLVVPDAKLDGRLDVWWPLIERYAGENGIDTDAKMVAFVASCLNETGLRAIEEASYINTSYERMREIFGSTAPLRRDVDEWRKLGKQAFDEKFFNHVYGDENRPNGYKLGNPPGTGYKYRGRGINQITGYPNYKQLAKETGLDLVKNPDLLLQPGPSMQVAMRYWSKNGLNELVAAGTEDGFLRGMKAMNPGLGDFSQHLHYWRALWEAMKTPVPKPLRPNQGYVTRRDGNVVNPDVKQSTIIKDSNTGSIFAGVAAAVSAVTPIISAMGTMDWKVATVLGAIAIVGMGLAAWRFNRIKTKRIEMSEQGIA